MSHTISSGCEPMNSLLAGGYEKEVITTVYGPAGVGKTNLCILATIAAAAEGKKVIYVDTEGGFSIARLKQLTNDHRTVLERTIFLKPTTFDEQKRAFEKLRRITTADVGMIIIDSIAMLYRLELGRNEDVYETNRELGKQIAQLTEVARKQKIPILMTNQIYASFEERKKINLVGGDILKYGSKCLVELRKGINSKRIAILQKHRALPEGKEMLFEIRNEGLFTFHKEPPKEEPTDPLETKTTSATLAFQTPKLEKEE